MGINGIFNQTITLLERSLDLRSIKHKSITSNVANIDTPNYKAFDVMVEDELKRQNRASGTGDAARVMTTSERHLAPHRQDTVRINRHTKTGDNNPVMRRDGNTVDLDREMASMSENSLMYTLSAQMVAKKFQSLRSVIQGGNK